MTKTLVFAVYDYDRFSKHDAIGEVRLPVCQMDLAQTKEIWKELQSIVGDGKVSNELSATLSTYILGVPAMSRILMGDAQKLSFSTLSKVPILIF